MGYRVGLIGATGMVGRTMLRVLEERAFPVDELRPMSSARSAGTSIEFAGESLPVMEASADTFGGLDLALFSAGGAVSRELAPAAVTAGAVVVDNSSALRLEPDVPLVVPEVNPDAARAHRGIIANPNCCAIPLTVVLSALSELSPLRRVVVDTYQSASGAGHRLVAELQEQRRAIALLQAERLQRAAVSRAGALEHPCVRQADGRANGGLCGLRARARGYILHSHEPAVHGVTGLCPREDDALAGSISVPEHGERLRLVRDPEDRVERMYWATYPVTREPGVWGRGPG